MEPTQATTHGESQWEAERCPDGGEKKGEDREAWAPRRGKVGRGGWVTRSSGRAWSCRMC